MNSKQIEAQFNAMGARFRTRTVPENRRDQGDYAMDIQRDRRGELFELRVPDSLSDQLEVNVLQVCPHERHLLLLVRRDRPERTLDRFLCGYDEREWFIAAVPGRVSSVAQAMESLKPVEVQTAQAQAGLTARQRRSRNNRAFRRQGEWFFVPTPALSPDPKLILRDEPIRRGSGKAHFVEMLYREGGSQVYVCGQYPNGIHRGGVSPIGGPGSVASQVGLAPDAARCSSVCARSNPSSGSPNDHAVRVASGADEHREPFPNHAPDGVPGLSQP